MTADSGCVADKREEIDCDGLQLVNGEFVSDRLDQIEFKEADGNSVAEMREKFSLDS